MTSNASSPQPLICVENITIGYESKIVMKEVSFNVYRGERFVILGGSGCGKSTLLKHMFGLYQPKCGKIIIDGRDIVQAEGAERQRMLGRLGIMYQRGALFSSLTLRENVQMVIQEFSPMPEALAEELAVMKLGLVGLADFHDYMPSEISGGMQKRAAIARALALDPEIVFMDEPSAGLDPITSADLDQLIIYLSEKLGITFVIVTHELDSIFTIADRIIMLDKEAKGIIAEGDPRRLREESKHPVVQQFFRRQSSHASREDLAGGASA